MMSLRKMCQPILTTSLSLEEIEKSINSATQIRKKAIIALLYSSGIRVGELVSLKPEDIYMSTMPVSYTHLDVYKRQI